MTGEPKGEPTLQSASLINAFLPDTGLCYLSRALRRNWLTQEKQDSCRSSEPSWMRMTLLPFESQWVKWKQNWNFRSFKIRKVELLHHLCALPTVPAMSVGDLCRGSADLVIWFNMINVTEHSSLPSLPTPFAKWLLLSSLCRMETAA